MNKDLDEAIKRINNLVLPYYLASGTITTSGCESVLGYTAEAVGGTIPVIEKVIFNPPTTIVIWKDGTKTIVRCGKDEVFYEDAGLAAAISKKLFGSRAAFLRVVEKAERQLPKVEYKNKKKVNK